MKAIEALSKLNEVVEFLKGIVADLERKIRDEEYNPGEWDRMNDERNKYKSYIDAIENLCERILK